MTMPGASCQVWSVAQLNSLGMALVTGIEECPHLTAKCLRHKLRQAGTGDGALLDRK
jgi:hypothetical protein